MRESQKTVKEEVALAEIEVEPKTESEPTAEECVETASDPIVQTDPGSKMVGFGKALASTLLGTAASTYASSLIYTVFYAQIYSILEEYLNEYFDFSHIELGLRKMTYGGIIVSSVIILAMATVALIFGIASIKTFIARKRAKCRKPVATLALGIYGLYSSVSALLTLLSGLAMSLGLSSLFYIF